MLSDYVRVSSARADDDSAAGLYDDGDVTSCLARIECVCCARHFGFVSVAKHNHHHTHPRHFTATILYRPVDLHQRVEIGKGAALTLFAAGHVLGAAMVLLEIGGVSIDTVSSRDIFW